ncbi:purine permease [Actinosynnema sp. ALI-1.44]|uniref:nucleobase:cation symporter-2 family protein n=1 Tax=Actinosynnema sp. ALI-1.44 TaxID=1933779 RepID=UPI00097C7D7B|nr:nucleobase:cation symporter-2 family protein [Actinosynnema sp. ALI-1.44]ONI89884.1 purine permease [Actinosynnema sp. ALI-1.44]
MFGIKRGEHPVDQVPPLGQTVALGLQHVLAMYAGAVAVPLIVGGALGLSKADIGYLINADLLVCGVATLIQCLGFWRFGARLPLMQGCTFAAVTPMVLIGKSEGITAIYGAVIVAGVVTVLLAPLWGRLLRFFPPLVTGTVITIIGLALIPVSVNWAAGGAGSPSFGAPRNLALALGVLLLVLVVQRFAPPALSRISVLVAIAVGTVVAIPLGFTDFSGVADAPVFGVSTPFHFGLPSFDVAAVIAMVVVMLVTMTETTGDILAVGEMAGRPVDGRRLADGLRADGLSTVLGGVFNTFPYTAFGQNAGLVGLTKVYSRFVVAAGGVILVILGLFPVLGEVVARIPAPVLGGAGIVMFGTVAAIGVKMLAKVAFDNSGNMMVVAVSLGIGLIPTAVPTIYSQFPNWFRTVMESGISAGAVSAVVLNLLFNHFRGKRAPAGS